MNKDWQPTLLGDLLKRSEKIVNIDPLETYKQVTVKLWGQGVILRDEVSGSEMSAAKRYEVKQGQFILSKIDARNGAFGLVPPSLDGALVSGDFPVFDINLDWLEPKYLEWKSKTREFVDLCRVASEGTTNRVRLKEGKFLRLTLLLPPLPEQRRIVAKIEALAAKVEEARPKKYETEKAVESIMESAIAKIFHNLGKELQLGDDKVAQVIAGQHILAEECTRETDSSVPYLTGPADFGVRVATPSRWTEKPKVISKPGDVLVTVKGAGVGKTNMAPNYEAAIGRQVMAIRPTKSFLTEFLYYFLRYSFQFIKDSATTTTVPGVKKQDVERLNLPNLTIEEQRHIVAYLEVLQAKLDALKKLQVQTAVELDALLPAILDRAFKGEL